MSKITDALPVLLYQTYDYKRRWNEQQLERLGLLIPFDTIRRMYECYQMVQRWWDTYGYVSSPAINLDDTIIIHSNQSEYLVHYMYWDNYNYSEEEVHDAAALLHNLISFYYPPEFEDELIPARESDEPDHVYNKSVILYRMLGQLDSDDLENLPSYIIRAVIGPTKTTFIVATDDLNCYSLFQRYPHYREDLEVDGEIHHMKIDIYSEDLVNWYELVVSIESGLLDV